MSLPDRYYTGRPGCLCGECRYCTDEPEPDPPCTDEPPSEDTIRAVGIWMTRHWQRCWWMHGTDKLFIEQTYTPWMKPMHSVFWLNGHAATEAELLASIAALGLDPDKYEASPEFYGEGYFPLCNSMADALAYVNAQRETQHG